MNKEIKSQKAILEKLGIETLNPMQIAAQKTIAAHDNTILLSPTGSGKTLAFLLPILDLLNPKIEAVQTIILVPSRELAIQIEQVAREMGSGFKVNAVYGGRSIKKDQIELQQAPQILVGTPGRMADHFGRETFDLSHIRYLVLDEFDKSLEIGFEEDMIDILDLILNQLDKKILTSATFGVDIPSFVRLDHPKTVDFLEKSDKSKLTLRKVVALPHQKLEKLLEVIQHIGNQPGIIFCNFKGSIQAVSNYLLDHKIPHGCFHGDLEQRDRERSLIKFRNGTHQLIVATDLAARGLDIPEINYIIHFENPPHLEEFTHRNGRTARMHADGIAYVLQEKNKRIPPFIEDMNLEEDPLKGEKEIQPTKWKTLFISGGRKDKVSKGDIVGFLIKEGKLNKNELGHIELKNDCAFVAVHRNRINHIVQKLNNKHIKKRKVRLRVV